MELREWLIILGLALVSLIVIDGVRRLQRQRRVPRLDQAEKDLPAKQMEDPDEAAKEAEINWELPNGGARVVKPADYSGLGNKPKLERQEHPGPSRVLAEFKRSASAKVAKRKADKAEKAEALARSKFVAPKADKPVAAEALTPSVNTSTKTSYILAEHERREPSLSVADEPTVGSLNVSPARKVGEADSPASTPFVSSSSSDNTTADVSAAGNIAAETPAPTASHAREPATPGASTVAANSATANVANVDVEATKAETTKDSRSAAVSPQTADSPAISANEVDAEPTQQEEPVLRAEPEDAVFAKHSSSEQASRRRQLRSDTVGEHGELDDDAVDEYRLVDFEGMARSFKRRLIERRQEKQRKKAEKALRDKALAKQKAERKALEAEQRREAKEAADAERARLAQEQAQAREAAATAAAAEKLAAQQRMEAEKVRQYELNQHAHYAAHSSAGFDEHADYSDDEPQAYEDAAEEAYNVNHSVRAHPTLEKALRHDVSGEHAKETLSSAEEVVVISVLSRDPEGFDGSKLLELMMVCGLRYSSEMGIFHRFETESEDSELQFSMVNVVKPGTFPIEEMGEFMTPGITLLMPLPGAIDSSAAFEAMVETAMVVVRHMGGELKDEHRSVMTAQTIEFARQRVREFERRHRLHRQMQAR